MIGIDVSDRSVKMVQLSNDGQRRLLAHCLSIMPESAIEKGIVKEAKVAQAVVKQALEQCRPPGKLDDAVIVSIPETQSFLRVVEVPTMQEDEISEAVQWEVAQHIPFGLDNVYIDWQPLVGGHRPAGGRQEVLVGAAQKKVVDSLLAMLSGLSIDIAAFELESQALVRALISQELRTRQGLLIVDIGDSATNVVIHDHGALRFTASLEKGVNHLINGLGIASEGMLGEELGKMADEQRQHFTEQLQPGLEKMVAEVRGIVEFYNSIDVQHEVKEVILAGGGANVPGLERVFLRHFENVHVQRGNPWVNILSGQRSAKPPMDARESVRYATALGLALRSVPV